MTSWTNMCKQEQELNKTQDKTEEKYESNLNNSFKEKQQTNIIDYLT